MATLIVHGTMTNQRADRAGFWWWHPESGFCQALNRGLIDAGDLPDVWQVDGADVSTHAAIQMRHNGSFTTHQGRFLWTGLDQPELRRIAGKQLAHYLNLIHEIAPDETIRIVAHSHGCNVVKIASAARSLHRHIFIDSAVFLACPHFKGEGVGFLGNIPYRLNPGRFGRILNLYSKRDSVQVDIARRVPSLWGGGLLEWAPTSHRCDPDARAQDLYENHQIATEDSGVKAHASMHAEEIAYLAGLWIGSPDYFDNALANTNRLPVPADHTGD